MRIQKIKRLQGNERGFASLVVGLILIVVLGLLTIGFARLSRHEQQQALNSQLASEAYYAAESGIDDAVSAVESTIPADQITTATPDVDSGSCLSMPLPGAGSNIINTDDDVSYSCVLVNMTLPQLIYGPVNSNTGRTIVTNASTSSAPHDPLTQLTVNWGSSDGQYTYPGLGTKFPDNATWNTKKYPGVLQLSITPLSSPIDRNGLINNSFTVFLYPASSVPNTVNYNQGDNGADGSIVPGNCAGTGEYVCSVTIKFILPTGQYLIHFLDLYDSSNINITGKDSSGDPVTFSGGQAQIDVTGKAKDVLKRISVTVPLGSTDFPDYAIEAHNICKRMETGPVSPQNINGTGFVDAGGGQATSKPCELDL